MTDDGPTSAAGVDLPELPRFVRDVGRTGRAGRDASTFGRTLRNVGVLAGGDGGFSGVSTLGVRPAAGGRPAHTYLALGLLLGGGRVGNRNPAPAGQRGAGDTTADAADPTPTPAPQADRPAEDATPSPPAGGDSSDADRSLPTARRESTADSPARGPAETVVLHRVTARHPTVLLGSDQESTDDDRSPDGDAAPRFPGGERRRSDAVPPVVSGVPRILRTGRRDETARSAAIDEPLDGDRDAAHDRRAVEGSGPRRSERVGGSSGTGAAASEADSVGAGSGRLDVATPLALTPLSSASTTDAGIVASGDFADPPVDSANDEVAASRVAPVGPSRSETGGRPGPDDARDALVYREASAAANGRIGASGRAASDESVGRGTLGASGTSAGEATRPRTTGHGRPAEPDAVEDRDDGPATSGGHGDRRANAARPGSDGRGDPLSGVDVSRFVDRLHRELERKRRIERERRGL